MAETDKILTEIRDLLKTNQLQEQKQQIKEDIKDPVEETRTAQFTGDEFSKISSSSNMNLVKMLKEKVFNPKDWFQPKNLIGFGGLLFDAPIFMLIGDNVQNMYDGLKEMRKDNMTANKKNELLLKKQVSADELKKIQEQTAMLGSKDSEEIKRILINNGINSQDQIDTFIDNIKSQEDRLIKDNARNAYLLEQLGMSNEEIGNALRTGAGIDKLKSQLDEQKNDEAIQRDEKQLALLEAQLDSLNGLEDSIKKEEGGLFESLFSLAGIAGLALGAVVKKVVLPFELLGKVLTPLAKPLKMLGTVKDTLAKPFISLYEFLSKLPMVGKFITKMGGFLGTFFNAFKIGFKVLGWPLQIIMSAIDFFKGFQKTEGDIVDKIKGGLMGVVKGFVELPLKLLGKAADWFLGLFGVEIDDGAGKFMVDGVMNAFSLIFDAILYPFRMLKEVFTESMNVLNGAQSPIDALRNIGSYFLDFFKQMAIKALKVLPGGSWVAKKFGWDLGNVDNPEDVVANEAKKMNTFNASNLSNNDLQKIATRKTVKDTGLGKEEKTTIISSNNNNNIIITDMEVRTEEYTINRFALGVH